VYSIGDYSLMEKQNKEPVVALVYLIIVVTVYGIAMI